MSLALDTASKFGVPSNIVQRARELRSQQTTKQQRTKEALADFEGDEGLEDANSEMLIGPQQDDQARIEDLQKEAETGSGRMREGRQGSNKELLERQGGEIASEDCGRSQVLRDGNTDGLRKSLQDAVEVLGVCCH